MPSTHESSLRPSITRAAWLVMRCHVSSLEIPTGSGRTSSHGRRSARAIHRLNYSASSIFCRGWKRTIKERVDERLVTGRDACVGHNPADAG